MPGLMVAGFDEDDLRKMLPVMIYLDNQRQPLEWLDEEEASRLAAAFREKRADGVMEVFRSGTGRLESFVDSLVRRPADPIERRDMIAFMACFYNTAVFTAARAAGFLGRAAKLFSEAGAIVETDFLDQAISVENIEIVRMLLDEGDDPSRRFEDGAPPLYRACFDKANLEIVGLLLERGARVDGWTASGCTALSAAVVFSDEAAVDLLLAHGATAAVKAGEDATLLHQAAGRSSAAIVEKLLRRGADPHARDDSGKTPLHFAAATGNAETVRLLLDAGADVGARNRDGLFPLRVAVKRGRLDAVAVLLARGSGDSLDEETRDKLVGMAKYMQKNHRDYFGDERGVSPRESARRRQDIVDMLEKALGTE